MEQSQDGGAAASGVPTSLSHSEPLASLLERAVTCLGAPPWTLEKENSLRSEELRLLLALWTKAWWSLPDPRGLHGDTGMPPSGHIAVAAGDLLSTAFSQTDTRTWKDCFWRRKALSFIIFSFNEILLHGDSGQEREVTLKSQATTVPRVVGMEAHLGPWLSTVGCCREIFLLLLVSSGYTA